MTDVIDTLINKPFGTTIVPPAVSSAPVSRTYTATALSIPAIPLLKDDDSTSDFEYTVEDNSLHNINIIEGK